MKTVKTTAKSFRFTPQEWDMIEAEAIRLNMSKAFFVHLAVTNAIGKFKPFPSSTILIFCRRARSGAVIKTLTKWRNPT